jgi:hypothetical protein
MVMQSAQDNAKVTRTEVNLWHLARTELIRDSPTTSFQR